jgi:nicotinate-nucleotide adenylyltransferase
MDPGAQVYIGIYGGTFNPIHFGHLRTAEEICERFLMKEVIFIPSASPPHKDAKDIVDPMHRLKMTNLAVTGNARFSVSELETQRQGKSYSIDTVRELKRLSPDDQFAFILGIDAFLEIVTWHKYEEIFNECDFIVTTRPGVPRVSCAMAIPSPLREGFKRKKSGREFVNAAGKQIIFADVTDLNISATAIRAMVREGNSIRYLMPRRVMDYIAEHGLYK